MVCDCGACREIEPEALARLVGWSVTLEELAQRMRCSRRQESCRGGRGGEAARAGFPPARNSNSMSRKVNFSECFSFYHLLRSMMTG